MKNKFVIVVITLFSLVASARPDKVGNGGGLWVCQDQSGNMYDMHFMDVFEARKEYQLNIPEITIAPLEMVQAKKLWIETYLPNEVTMIEEIQYVEQNILWLDDVVITSIPDGANKISPKPDSCPQGKWEPVQLVNFTEDGRILARRDLFDSELLSDLERGAVYLHEGVYSYLRKRNGDETSVRARAIVGYLISDLTNGEKVAKIQAELDREPPKPTPPPAEDGVICGLKPEEYRPLYIAVAKDEALARERVIGACKHGENPFSDDDDFEFPGFPDFPGNGGSIGPGIRCEAAKVSCESYSGAQTKYSCSFKTRFHETPYSSTGRTELEAKANAMNKCMATEGSEHLCYDGKDWNCTITP